jgi:hypothetical protein
MAQPFDYRLQVQDPFESTLGAVKIGQSLLGVRAAQQKAALEQQAMQQALERQENFQTRANKIIQGGVSNATAEDFAELAFFTDKDTAKTLQETWSSLDKSKQQNLLGFAAEVTSALANKRPEIAEQRLRERAARLRESNRPEDLDQAKVLEAEAELAKNDPEFLEFDLKFKLAALPGGKEYLENVDKALTTRREEELRPERLTEQRAKALKASVDADFAASQAVKDLALKQAQIDNYAADQEIARENLKINKLNADLKKEENVLKRRDLEAKLVDAQTERDEKLRKRVSDANTAFANFDNFLNTADRALAGWEKDKAGKIDIKKPKGYVESATGPISTRLPTLSQDTADFEELIEVLKGQAFLSQIEKMKGLGAMSDKEGDALRASLTNLSLRQSPEQLGRNLLEAQRLILKARNEAARKYGVGAAPDRPAGPGGAAPAQAPGVPSAMGTATDRAVAPTAAPAAMPSGFRVLGRE